MACRGVYFALSTTENERLLAAAGDDEAVITIIQEEIESAWDTDWLAETDKAWDAIHRCLADGRLLFDDDRPLALCVLGGRRLYSGDDYIVTYVTAVQVGLVAAAIRGIDEQQMKARYLAIPEDDYGCPLTDEDFEYTWDWFKGVRELYVKAADAKRPIIFSVDQ
jgi:hypothetical protein